MAKRKKKIKKVNAEEKFDAFYIENSVYYTRIPDSYKNRESYKPLNTKVLLAFIPGTIREMQVKVGDAVIRGNRLMILDAMKMNNEVKSFVDGKVKAIHVKDGDMVRKNQLLIEFE
ncbi:MAG: acetyl-CoA carboxylase biotin carboxyl carrier protein subunit [Bacteroidales bacterium]|nr:acetyl-CoA carboxylase biotin carboxyl carrier protein subunit [Bacteroidales bacterium]